MPSRVVAVVMVGGFALLSITSCEEQKENATAVNEAQAPADTQAVELSWVDEVTGETLFTVEDIVRFDWERQVFELERSRAMDLTARFRTYGQCRGFRVQDAQGIIYRGSFFSAASSMAYRGPTILMDGGALSLPHRRRLSSWRRFW